ncbi:MAG: DUF3795 domain-containing protein [Syntrophaceae bacterium]|nr:DUF3795 domain-containing protein [Syntrophaceae bacterium]
MNCQSCFDVHTRGCGACGVYIAARDKNEKFMEVMGNLYGTKKEDTQSYGCMQTDPSRKLYGYCSLCTIRNCVREKGCYSCHQCSEWPCELIENFGLATGVRVMKRAIPLWRSKVAELGNEKGSVEWARAELKRYHCNEAR